MSVRVRLLWARLRAEADDLEFVEVEGGNVGECLDDLVRKFPAMKELIVDKIGKLQPYLEIFINNKTTFPEELTSPVNNGDELSILALLAGG